MKAFRLFLAAALLRGAGTVAGVIAGPDLENSQPAPPLHPVEWTLLASLVGLAICFVWIAATWRAWS
jgi:hypothetical protein